MPSIDHKENLHMEMYYTLTLSNSKSICISALTDEQLIECGALERFGGVGYFLYERDILDGEEEIDVLAHVSSDIAAERLAKILRAADPRYP